MDIVENGISAGASLIVLTLEEDSRKNLLVISIEDNGSGMSENMLKRATDPFFTTRTTRRVGLGLSLFREACLRCDGKFAIESNEGAGTRVRGSFKLDHIDLAPLGDMGSSISGLIVGNPSVDFVYSYYVDGKPFTMDTRDIKNELEGLPITHPKVVGYIRELIREAQGLSYR